jgi:hypothetical protein
MAEELKVRIIGDATDLNAALSDAQKSLVAFSKQAAELGKTMSTYVTAPLLAAGAASIKMASDFNESLNKVDVSFKSASGSATEFAKTSLKTYGIASGTALDMASNFGDMATSMGLGVGEASKLSTSLVGLAGDMASFKNIRIDVAQTALNGIFTGETESLKRLGIVMTEANVKAYAFSQGITKQYDTMSQAEKVMLRYQYVMSVTKNAQGDFARTNENAANQMRMFGEGMKQLSAEIGQVMLPAVTSITRAANDMITGFSGASDGTKSFVVTLGLIAAGTGPLLFLVGTIVPKVIEGFNLMTAAAVKFNLTLTSATGIAGLAALFGVAAKSAYDYAKALNPDNKLTAQEAKDTNAIKEKNKQIVASIELLKKQRGMATGPITGLNTAQGISTQSIDAQIAAQQKLLVQNNALIKSIEKKAIADAQATTIADAAAIKEQQRVSGALGAKTAKKGKAAKDPAEEARKKAFDESNKYFAGEFDKLTALKEKVAKEDQAIADASASKFLTDRQKEVGNLAEIYDQQVNERIKLHQDTSLIDDKFRADQAELNAKYDQEDLLALEDKFAETNAIISKFAETDAATAAANVAIQMEKIMAIGQLVADTAGQAFRSLGDSIVQSMGLASTGLEGFAQVMMQTLVKLGTMILQQIIMNQASAMASAVAGATQSGAATGPAAIFTTPAFIATAVGGVLSAFAAIPKFAAGGIVSGPTMGLMGEYPGAKSNPEVIAPLSKLQGMLDQGNGGGGAMSGEFVLRGQDLVVALARAEKQRNRIG